MYYGASLFTSINPLLLLCSANAEVIGAALLFVVYFPVIKGNLRSKKKLNSNERA